MPMLPQELSDRVIASSRMFDIHEKDLVFSNGARRTFECIRSKVIDGVVILIAINDKQEILLVREYAAALNTYLVGLPRGGFTREESPLQAAQRELSEELKVGAHSLTILRELVQGPTVTGMPIKIILAQSLYPNDLEGDEPEPLDIVPWPLSDLDGLIRRTTDLQSVLALYLLQQHYRDLK